MFNLPIFLHTKSLLRPFLFCICTIFISCFMTICAYHYVERAIFLYFDFFFLLSLPLSLCACVFFHVHLQLYTVSDNVCTLDFPVIVFDSRFFSGLLFVLVCGFFLGCRLVLVCTDQIVVFCTRISSKIIQKWFDYYPFGILKEFSHFFAHNYSSDFFCSPFSHMNLHRPCHECRAHNSRLHL